MLVDFTKYDQKQARDIAKKYGTAILNQMQFNIQYLDLIDKSSLYKSLKFSVGSTYGEVDKITFSYEWYGKFFEMGAENVFGKGVRIKPLHWRKTAIEHYSEQLFQEFADMYAKIMIEEIVLPDVRMKM